MRYTQKQLLELTGMSFERLRHWRKEMPELAARAGRGANYTFEEVAVLAVLSLAVDEIGLGTKVFAPFLTDLFAVFVDNDRVGDADMVLWFTADQVEIGPVDVLPDGNVVAMVRIEPVLARLMARLRPVTPPQFILPL